MKVDGQSGRSYTFNQLSSFSRKVGSAMIKRGLQKGDVFALHLPNLPEYPILLYGVSSVGGVVTTLNPRYTQEELVFQLKNCRAKYIITMPPFVEKIKQVSSEVGISEIFVLGNALGCTPFSVLLADDGGARGFKVNPREDLFCLPYSSGTTGLPKGVMWTHYNLVAHTLIRDFSPVEQNPEQDVLLGFLPFFHSMLLSGALGGFLFQGNKIVSMSQFDGELMLKFIQKYKVCVHCDKK